MTDTTTPAVGGEAPAPATLVGGAAAPALPTAEAPAPTGAAALYPDGEAPATPAAETTPAPTAETPTPVEGETPPAPTPDSYKDLKFRDGFTPAEATLKSFTELAAKAGLSSEDAQALVDLQQDIATEQGTAFREAQEAAYNQTQTEWRTEAMKLPWLSSDPNPETNPGLQAIGVLFDEFDKTGQFKAMLNQTGTGNHPATLQFLYDVVQTLVEGSPTAAGRAIASGPNGKARGNTPAQIMYPNTNTN